MTIHAALAGRIRQEQADIQRLVTRAESLMEKARRSGDDGYLDGAALNLHGFYTAAELVEELGACCRELFRDLEAFCRFLGDLDGGRVQPPPTV